MRPSRLNDERAINEHTVLKTVGIFSFDCVSRGNATPRNPLHQRGVCIYKIHELLRVVSP